jgi:hypothetical protein
MAQLMRKMLPPGRAKDFDAQQADSVIKDAAELPNSIDTNLEYFLGMFLKNRGEAEKSREYLVRCGQSKTYTKHNHVLACQILRDLKIPISPKQR